MKMSLTIEASAATIAKIIKSLPADLAVQEEANFETHPEPLPMPGNVVPSTPIGSTTPMPPVPTMPAPTMPAFSAPAQSDENDEDGPAHDSDTDSRGIIWDQRIHSAGKSVNKDGSWKKRKNCDPALLQAIEASQRGGPAGMDAAIAGMPVIAPVVPFVAPPSLPDPQTMPVPETVPVPTAPPVTTPVPVDFMGLLGHVAKLTEAQRVDATYLADLVKRISDATGTPLNSLVDLNGKPELIAYTVQVMQHDQRW